MQLHFLGKETQGNKSPTLFDTDRNTYLVQGWKVTDPEHRAQLAPGVGEDCVEVPEKLMSYLAASLLRVTDDAQPPVIIRTDHGTAISSKGQQVADADGRHSPAGYAGPRDGGRGSPARYGPSWRKRNMSQGS